MFVEAWGLPGEEERGKVVGHAASPSREAVIGAPDNFYAPCCREREISLVEMGLIESIEIYDRRSARSWAEI